MNERRRIAPIHALEESVGPARAVFEAFLMEDARTPLKRGDGTMHRLVADAVAHLRGADAIILAQFSLARDGARACDKTSCHHNPSQRRR
jgi:hypothetical protein